MVVKIRPAFLTLLIPGVCSAQIRGQVLDRYGTPVQSAVIEIWQGGARRSITSANERGYFVGPAVAPPAEVVVRQIGFLPSRATILDTSLLIVRLRSREALVSAVNIAGDQVRCITEDHPEGRRLWHAMRTHYGTVPVRQDGRVAVQTLWGDGRALSEYVPVEALGVLDTSRLTPNMVMGGMYVDLRLRPRSAAEFYAPPHSGLMNGRHDRYEYPYLDSYLSWHFADSLFGAWNYISAPVITGDSLVLEFCSRRGRNERFITGVLHLTRDSALSRAIWTFVSADERAGGEVTYAPISSSDSLPPLALIGLAWRRTIRRVFQEWYVFSAWSICLESCRQRRALKAF